MQDLMKYNNLLKQEVHEIEPNIPSKVTLDKENHI